VNAEKPLRIAVLMGGRSAEREVSLTTGAQVAEALAAGGADVVAIDSAAPDFIARLQESGADVCFICLHGRFGEDGTVQGLLELIGMPYVGSGVLASALAMDKVMSKHFFAQAGLPSPAYVHLRAGQAWDAAEITSALGAKTVVKPANEGSAIGVTISHDPGELPDAIETAFRYDDDVLVEAFVPGVEVTVGVLGNENCFALPAIEIVPEHEFYDYDSKYVPGMSRHIMPPRIGVEQLRECERISIAAHVALGCRGVSRADCIVAENGDVWLLEVNTIPGMTPTSLLPDSAREAGIAFPDLVRRLVDYALDGR